MEGFAPHRQLLVFERIFQAIPEPLLVLDAEMAVIEANEPFYRLCPAARAENEQPGFFELGGGQWDLFELRTLIENISRDPPGPNTVEIKQEFPGLGERFLSVSARKMPSNDGLPALTLLSIRDVTERRMNDRRMEELTAELRRSNRDLEELAQMASHDLQEPLRKIRAFGDRLKSLCGNSLPDEGSRYLDRMLFSAARMQKLIGSLLTLARVCQEAAFFVPTDLNAIAAETLEALDEAIERTKATIHLSVLPTIKADAVQMGLLFQNLISNALKFHGSDKCPEITIFSRSCSGLTSTLEARWEIVFEDKGIGFEERHKERMFGVFQRLNSKDQYEGSGLGLSICRRIVTRHQGFISVDSRLGEGSTFTVNLPCDASGSRTATGLSQASR